MTVNEALQRTQGRGAGMMNGSSARYAQTLLLPGEEVSAAVVANIVTRGERFPGVVVLTDRRVMAVCGLPGIKRSVILSLEELERCQETPSALNYKAAFYAGKEAFSFTVDPDTGEKFSRFIAILNGDEDAFDAAAAQEDSGIFNPTLVRNKRRAKMARDKERAKRAAAREAVPISEELSAEAGETAQETAQRLARQLEQARAKGTVPDTDPQAIAARLAAELAAQEDSTPH